MTDPQSRPSPDISTPTLDLLHLKTHQMHDRSPLRDPGDKTSDIITNILNDSQNPKCSTPKDKRTRRVSFLSLWQQLKALPWKLEVLSWISSFLCFMAIVIILGVFRGRSLPELPLNISLNSIVALLGTFSEILFMYPVASAIGQLKWLRARRQRPMNDFRLMDDASRGSLGSVLLLIQGRGGVFVSVGAFITILALATNTFIQQVLKYETAWPSSNKVFMPVARYMNGSGSLSSGKMTDFGVDESMIPALYNGVFNNVDRDIHATAHCDTGNCTWPSYQTLAICSTCANMTANLTSGRQHDREFFLPNGFGLNRSRDDSCDGRKSCYASLMNLTHNDFLGMGDDFNISPAPSLAFNSTPSVWFSIFAVGPLSGIVKPGANTYLELKEDRLTSALAYECAFQFCIHDMEAQFAHDILSENITSTWKNDTLYLRASESPNGADDIVLHPPGSNESFVIKQLAAFNTRDWLATVLSGSVMARGMSQHSGTDFMLEPTSDITQAIFLAMNSSDTGFPDLMDILANSLSVAMRNFDSSPHIVGTSYTTISHFVVRWPWLILPFALLLASLALLVVVIFETKRKGLLPWSNNSLALLFHGLNERPTGRGVADRQDVMEDAARQCLMEFQTDADGGHLAIRS